MNLRLSKKLKHVSATLKWTVKPTPPISHAVTLFVSLYVLQVYDKDNSRLAI